MTYCDKNQCCIRSCFTDIYLQPAFLVLFPSVQFSRWVGSDSLWPHELLAARQARNPRANLLQNGLVGSPCSPRDSQESSPTPHFKSINSSVLSLLPSPTLTSIHDHCLLNPEYLQQYLLKTCSTLLLCIKSAPLLTAQSLYRLLQFNSVQFTSVAQSCSTLCDPMNRSTPGLPVHHQLPEFTQTHVHRVSDAIQPSHPLSSFSPPAPNPSQHQSLFQWVNSSNEVAKVLEFQL